MDWLLTHLAEVHLSNWIAVAALGIAFASLWISRLGYQIAKKSYLLAKQTSESSAPQFSSYLVDAFRYRDKSADSIIYVFAVSLENKSTIQNSIVSVEMRLPLMRDGLERLAVFGALGVGPIVGGLQIRNTAQLPSVVHSRGAIIANFCFEVPNEMLKKAEYDLHILRIKFADGPFVEIRPKFVMDVIDVQDLEKKRRSGVPL